MVSLAMREVAIDEKKIFKLVNEHSSFIVVLPYFKSLCVNHFFFRKCGDT